MPAPRVSDLYRTAFVTGASTGLGRAFAEMLLADGVKVWGTARAASRLDSFSGNAAFKPVVLDLKDGAAAEKMFRDAARDAGGFDLVINNAGYGVFGEFSSADFSVWADQLTVMLVNTARLSHVAVQLWRERTDRDRKAALVNISSLAAEFPLPFQSAYNMAKAGLTALNESLMLELADTGIVVLDVRPGDYRTDFEGSVQRVGDASDPRLARAWRAFEKMMQSGPEPAHAARRLRCALLSRQTGTLRTGRFFQAVVAPLIARLGSLRLKRRIQARYFDVS